MTKNKRWQRPEPKEPPKPKRWNIRLYDGTEKIIRAVRMERHGDWVTFWPDEAPSEDSFMDFLLHANRPSAVAELYRPQLVQEIVDG